MSKTPAGTPPERMQAPDETLIREYVEGLYIRAGRYGVSTQEARQVLDRQLGQASLTDALYRMRRDGDVV